ncbi:MAG: BrnT family toxin [Planctomycetota bacterium]
MGLAVLIGESFRGRLLVVVHTERGDTLRLICARRASAGERRTHEQA